MGVWDFDPGTSILVVNEKAKTVRNQDEGRARIKSCRGHEKIIVIISPLQCSLITVELLESILRAATLNQQDPKEGGK